jgi:hypothetical protein
LWATQVFHSRADCVQVVKDRTMKAYVGLLTLALCSGCLVDGAKREALSQIETSMDVRYREVMENLAMIYANPDALPAYSAIFYGTMTLQDSVMVSPTTLWQRNVAGATRFNSQVLDIPASRQVAENWTLDPQNVPEKLAALRAACQWVLFRTQPMDHDGQTLGAYQPTFCPGYYFGVADQLATLVALDPCWLHCGTHRSDVPRCACYWTGCHGKYIWVEPTGMHGLSQFTMILQQIARYDLSKGPQPYVKTRIVTFNNVKVCDKSIPPSKGGEVTVKSITFYVDENGTPVAGPGLPFLPPKNRYDNVGLNSEIKSVVSAVSKPL